MLTALACIATAVYFEARSEPIDGQLLVAETIINRVEDPRWPDTACEVVKQRKQFSFYSDGVSDKPTNEEAYATATQVAARALRGLHMNTDALWYHTTSVRPIWRHKLQPIGVVGAHIFYTDKE